MGLPLGSNYKALATWSPVIKRVERHLDLWRAKFLSRGGKVALIKSVLSNLPVFYMSILYILKSVVKYIEKLMRRFLWTSGDKDRSIHLIGWDKVCLPKDQGGLGIQSLEPMNKALLAKWLWRYGEEREAIWRQRIAHKYGVDAND